MKSTWLALLCAGIHFLSLCSFAHCHGYLKEPKSRNYAANSEYCPHCLNAGGVGAVAGAGGQWPDGKHGVCGDSFRGSRDHEEGGKNFSEVYLSTNHYGRFQFRICRYKLPGGEKEHLTEDCLNRNILKQANTSLSQAPGEKFYYILPDDATSGNYTMFYELPQGLTCDGKSSKCVLQWYWLTGNSCHPPHAPLKYRTRSNMFECGEKSAAYPEEFWNCASIRILPKKKRTNV
jgi:hypothetical protein